MIDVKKKYNNKQLVDKKQCQSLQYSLGLYYVWTSVREGSHTTCNEVGVCVRVHMYAQIYRS